MNTYKDDRVTLFARRRPYEVNVPGVLNFPKRSASMNTALVYFIQYLSQPSGLSIGLGVPTLNPLVLFSVILLNPHIN